MQKRTNTGKSYAIVILYMFIVLSAFLSVSLFLEKRYYPMTVWIIIAVVFLIFAYLALRTGKGIPSDKRNLKGETIIDTSIAAETQKDENYVRLISTKNPIEVEAIKSALMANNISCVVFDQHSVTLVRFMPDVEMRIMVPGKNYEDGLRIIGNLKKEGALNLEFPFDGK
jgi:hypothetical protein